MNTEVLQTANIWSQIPKETPPWLSSSLTVRPVRDMMEPQLDFFHKLGYSTAQVQAVQHKFGSHTSTDKLLGELVKIGASTEAKKQPLTTMSVLVPKGDVPPAKPAVLLPISAGFSQEESGEDDEALRPIVIDGSNVAMSHGNKEVFSCLGIQLAVNFFLVRGHTTITVFVPSWRSEKPRPDVPISDQHILRELEKKKILVFTPSKRIAGKRVVCHDDRYIVKLAYESDGVIVSNDLYRDLQGEKPEWKRFIEERLLMYSFVNNKFMPPDDPLGRHGPTLDNFLRKFPKTQKKQPCPYGKKCTFGIKCKYSHPERPKQSNQTLADELRTSQRRSPPHCSSQPGQSLLLVEDMAKKLTLETVLLKKEHSLDGPPHVKGSHRKKSTLKKEKNVKQAAPEQSFMLNSESQEQLDSGLGSIDPQPFDLWGYGTSLYNRPQSAPCSCPSHLPPSHHTFQQHHVLTSSSDMSLAYSMSQYPSYRAYSGGIPTYSQPPDFQQRLHRPSQQMYWSDPYAANPRAASDGSHWEPNQPSPGNKDQREVVRKKLLAIFSAQLVDAAMDLNPHVMDPQRLAAEILMLQSHGRAMR